MTQDDSGPTDDHDPLPARQIEAMAGYGVSEGEHRPRRWPRSRNPRLHLSRRAPDRPSRRTPGCREPLPQGDRRRAQSVAAAIFWLKTRAGWKETTVHEHGGAEGMPLVIIRQIVDPRDDDASSPGAPLIEARPMRGK